MFPAAGSRPDSGLSDSEAALTGHQHTDGQHQGLRAVGPAGRRPAGRRARCTIAAASATATDPARHPLRPVDGGLVIANPAAARPASCPDRLRLAERGSPASGSGIHGRRPVMPVEQVGDQCAQPLPGSPLTPARRTRRRCRVHRHRCPTSARRRRARVTLVVPWSVTAGAQVGAARSPRSATARASRQESSRPMVISGSGSAVGPSPRPGWPCRRGRRRWRRAGCADWRSRSSVPWVIGDHRRAGRGRTAPRRRPGPLCQVGRCRASSGSPVSRRRVPVGPLPEVIPPVPPGRRCRRPRWYRNR